MRLSRSGNRDTVRGRAPSTNRDCAVITPIEVRPVRRDDFPAWLVLWEGYNAFYGRSDDTALPAEITEMTWSRFFDAYEPMHALVAESGGELLGLTHFLYHHSGGAELLSPGSLHGGSRAPPRCRAGAHSCCLRASQGRGIAARLLANTSDQQDRHAPLRWIGREIGLRRVSKGVMNFATAYV
jgi:GNAT superfamily N-acetyltransferase